MIFFLIAVVWFLCCCAGIVFLLFERTRFLASYIALGSTGATVASVVVPFGLVLGAKSVISPDHGWAVFVIGTVGFFSGGILGGVGGIILANRLNKKIPWLNTNASKSAM
jgi:hypothetical protein